MQCSAEKLWVLAVKWTMFDTYHPLKHYIRLHITTAMKSCKVPPHDGMRGTKTMSGRWFLWFNVVASVSYMQSFILKHNAQGNLKGTLEQITLYTVYSKSPLRKSHR